MKAGKAFVAGVIGAAVMSVLMWIARTMGMPASLEMMLGTMVTNPGATAWIIGLVMHLIIGGIFGLIYGWLFEHATHRAGWLVGGGFGIIHAIIAGIFMGMVPMMHPRMPNPVAPPGAFMSHLGPMGPVAVFVLHIVYGAVVGAIYAPALHTSPALDARTIHA